MFIMVDGIDGSGKSTVIDFWAEELKASGKNVCSLKSFWQEHGRHPTPNELGDCDIILSAEPTFVEKGKEIREKMIRDGSSATPMDIARAYADDRLVLYHKVLLPLLHAGKTILQDRGVSTSLCYQPFHHTELTEGIVSEFPGNAYALDHAPEHLVIVDAPADAAMARLDNREKQDHAIFERKEFLELARARFLHPAYQKLFTDHGTHIHILNGGAPIAILKQEAIQLLKQLTINT